MMLMNTNKTRKAPQNIWVETKSILKGSKLSYDLMFCWALCQSVLLPEGVICLR